MPTLCIETATERSIVSLMDEEEFLFHRELPYGLGNSKYLAPTIEEGLKYLKLAPHQLSCVAAGTGPGSYTGIRVAAAIAQSMAMGANVPLMGVCTLECFALAEDELPFAVLIDAKIGGVYLQIAKVQNGKRISLSKPDVCPLDELASKLTGIGKIITPNSQRLLPIVSQLTNNQMFQWVESAPNPVVMSQIVQEKLVSGHLAGERQLELLYLRETQAEVNRRNHDRSQ